MFDFIFDIPLLIAGPAILIILCVYALIGLRVIHRWLLPRLQVSSADSEFTGAMLQSVMVFYGLAVALIAVSVWGTYGEISHSVSAEATSLAALYRDVGGYPEPIRSQLQSELREYTKSVINEAWPQQRQGKLPTGGVKLMDRFQSTLIAFEPKTEGQKILHAEALRAYNQMIQARRLRLDSVKTGLPGILWLVVVAGAFIGLSATFFFRVDDRRLHQLQVILLAIFVGLVIFMILALDRPFRGDLGVGPEPYQLIHEQLMVPS